MFTSLKKKHMGHKLQNVYFDAYKNTIVSHNYLYRKTKLIGYMLIVVTYIITYCLLYFTDLHLERWNKLVICGGASLILFHIIYFIFYRYLYWKMKQTGYQLGVLRWYSCQLQVLLAEDWWMKYNQVSNKLNNNVVWTNNPNQVSNKYTFLL